jgi:toxin ParE1/3/4
MLGWTQKNSSLTAILYTQRALQDLREINRYTREVWGIAQARSYALAIRACLARLSDSPYLGRSCENISPGMRRMEQGSHIIFYRVQPGAVFIARILHGRMMPSKDMFQRED